MYSYHKQYSDSLLKTHSTVEDLDFFLEKMKLNELGRQKLGKYKLYLNFKSKAICFKPQSGKRSSAPLYWIHSSIRFNSHIISQE